MKATRLFVAWLLSTAAVTALASGGYHLYLGASPRKVLIVVDASYPMQGAWDRLPQSIAAVASGRHRTYALATDKGIVHGWREAPELGRTIPYGPRNLEGLSARLPPEAQDADEIVLITNAPPPESRRSGISRVVPVE
jgi:hypothetical protein